MPIWIWLVTLVKGFLPLDGKRIGKIIWVVVLSACVIGAYHKLFVAKSQVTKIEKITNYYECPKDESFVGASVHLWKLNLKLGI